VAESSRLLAFSLLGDLEVTSGGEPVALGGAKQRTLLALLLLARGRPVSSDTLIESLWIGSAPSTAQKIVQVYISGLRKALGDERIVTRPRGYELVVAPGELDLDRFEELARSAADAPPEVALPRLREALALVRGRPLEGLELEAWAAPEIERIEERVLVAREAAAEAELALGRPAQLVPELERLVAEHPYRERLLELLMLALYRSGRQAHALAAYRRGAAGLREELGLEPGRPLRELEAAILAHDPALDVRAPRTAALRMRGRPRARLAAVAAGTLLCAVAIAAGTFAFTRGDAASLSSLPPGIAVLSTADRSLVAQVPTSEVSQPVEVAPGSGKLWVASLDPPSTVEIDPRTGAIVRRLGSVFPGEPGTMFPDGSDIWFGQGGDLVRVNVVESRAVERHRLAGTGERFGLTSIARCLGSLWVADNEGQTVLRLDAATAAVRARIHVRYPWALACAGDAIWVSSGGVGIQRIDPRTNRIAATARVPFPNVTVLVGGGYAWTSNETNGTVYKVGRYGDVVATYRTGDGARQLTYAGGRVWVANGDAGTVTSIDAATGEQRTYAFRHPVQSAAAIGSRLLVILNEGATYEDRIDSLKGDVARVIVPGYVFDPPDPALGESPWWYMVARATCAGLVATRPGETGTVPDLARQMPAVSGDGRTYTFELRRGVRFAPPSNGEVTAEAIRYSVERALSPRLGSSVPALRFLGDVVGVGAYRRSESRHIRGIQVRGDTISFTLAKPSRDFLARLALPYFCALPTTTPIVRGGLTVNAPPSAGPYYVTDAFNGEYLILKRNPNYQGPRPARLDAIAFREGIADEEAVARVRAGTWDAAILAGALLAPGGAGAREAASDPRLRTEELPIRRIADVGDQGSLYALVSSRLGCDAVKGALELAGLCRGDSGT